MLNIINNLYRTAVDLFNFTLSCSFLGKIIQYTDRRKNKTYLILDVFKNAVCVSD